MPETLEDTALRDPSPGTRDRVIATAERLFREVGYQKTTVADIARGLGMSPANVYRFFDSKKSINEAVAERMIGEVVAEIEALVRDPRRSAAERLRAVIAALNRMSTDRFIGERRLHEMVEAAICESWQVCQHFIDRVEVALTRLVQEGQAAGEFDVEDPVVAAACLHAAVARFCHPALIVQFADRPVPDLDQMMDFLLRALRVRGENLPGPCREVREKAGATLDQGRPAMRTSKPGP